MVKFGCCLSIGSFVPQVEEEEQDILDGFRNGFKVVEKNSFDFVELTVNSVGDLSSEEFEQARELLADFSIPVTAFNCFIPGNLPLTGKEVDLDKVGEYLQLVMSRIQKLGGKYIVFGSGSARRVPVDFPREKAEKQLIQFLELCNKYAQKYDIIIAIEHLNKKETNIINSVAEGYELAQKVNLPYIKVLADCYHMYEENESYDILEKVGEDLVHVHIADKDRKYPGELRGVRGGGVDFADFFNTLKDIGYEKNISMECSFSDFKEDSKKALDYVKEIWSE